MARISVICFGDIDFPNNGYLVRTKMIVDRLLSEGNIVSVYQYSRRDSFYTKDQLTVRSIFVRHEKIYTKKSPVEKVIGFRPLKELYFPIDGFLKLSKYRKEIAKSDVIYIESVPLFQAYIFAKMLNKPITLDSHSINKAIALKLINSKKIEGYIRTAIWHTLERWVLRGSDKVITVSKNDADFITKHYTVDTNKIEIIENKVSLPDLARYSAEADTIKASLGLQGKPTACFIGDMKAIQNSKAREYIEQTLSKSVPEVTFLMVGNNQENHKSHGNVIYTGFVDSVDPYIIMSDVCIAPLSVGSGTKTKVLDYMKYDKKIVATDVALEGIEYERISSVYQTTISNFAEELKKQIRN